MTASSENDPKVFDDVGRVSIDNALRTAQQGTLALSAMADQKASVVLGATFVITSIVVGDVDGSNDITRLLLAITAIGSGVLAGLALMPGSNRGAATSRNPLFFAGVAEMSLDEYRASVRDMIRDDPSLYDALVVDLHGSATALAKRKYPLLRLSYQFLIVGMLATLASAILG